MKSAAIAVAGVIALAACAAPEPLPPKPAEVPAGLNLSGQWQLRQGDADALRQVSEIENRTSGGDASLLSRSGRDKRKAKPDYQVHVFLEMGSSLKITQTNFGLFVSFDRAVVEEYRFGEQRLVSVGPIQAERVSGWEQGGYVIETRDEDGAILYEAYRLEDPDTLVRTLRIDYRNASELDVRQVFDRA